MQSRVHGGNKAEISPMTAASHIPDRTNLYMDGVDANPVYETRTPATDLAPLAKGVLGSRPMHILPPVSSSSWWRRRLTTMRLSNDHPTRERRAEAIGGEGRECPPPPLRKWQTLGGGGGGGGRMSSANGRWRFATRSSRRHCEMTKDAMTTTATTIPQTIPSHVRRRVFLGRGVGRAGRGRRTTRRCPSRRHRRDGRRGRRSPGGGWAVRRGRRRNGTSWVRGGENAHQHYRRSSSRTMRASLLNRHRRRTIGV